MNGKEGLESLNNRFGHGKLGWGFNLEKETEAIRKDLDRLEKLEQKEMPIEPIIESFTFETKRGRGYQTNTVTKRKCPVCNNYVENGYLGYSPKSKYCPYCGQCLDFSKCAQ